MREKFHKRVIVLGSEGRIGKVICKELNILQTVVGKHVEWEYNVVRIDLQTGYDLTIPEELCRVVDENPNIYAMINATYPYNWIDHLKVYYNATKKLGEQMFRGVIINIASIYGVLGSDDRIYDNTNIQPTPLEYSMVKSGIIALSRAAATRYAKKNVRVNSICPGGVWSEGMDEKFVNNYIDRVPLRCMCSTKDVAGLCVYLLSNAAEYITGQNFMVDGGLSAW